MQELKHSRIRKYKYSKIQIFNNSKMQEFQNSKFYKFTYSKIHKIYNFKKKSKTTEEQISYLNFKFTTPKLKIKNIQN